MTVASGMTDEAASRAFRFFTPATLESPAGVTAWNLDSLRSGIESVPASSLFHHVLRIPARFPAVRDLPEHDFARWVGDALQLPEVSERLAFVGSAPVESVDQLRAALLGVLDRTSPGDRRREAADGAAFHFVEVRTALVPLGLEASDPVDTIEVWPTLDLGSAFLHLVEASYFGWTDQALIPWLRSRGAAAMANAAASLVAAGLPLARLHRDVRTRWRRSMIGKRLAERMEVPEEVRRREARQVMARLAERLRSGKSDKETGP